MWLSWLFTAFCGFIILAHTAILPQVSPSSLDSNAAVSDPITVADTSLDIAANKARRNEEEDAMRILESAISADSNPDHSTNTDTINSWNLHLCLVDCEIYNSYDRTKLTDHSDLKTRPENEWVFRMCNQACFENYQNWMQTWPPANSKAEHIFTSTALYSCASRCTTDAAHDNTLLKTFHGMPAIFADATIADCNQDISRCMTNCEEDFGEELQDWYSETRPIDN